MAAETCFVIMPYGTRPDADGTEVDFDEIYDHIIKPAVEGVDGLVCERCDNIAVAGSVHEQMLKHIWEDRVAVVDISTLNANVFYELGVRHALRRSATILIRREGTESPFNIAGMKAITYSTSPAGVAKVKAEIQAYIRNALATGENDSLVYSALPDLSVARGDGQRPRRIAKVQCFEYPLVRRPECRLGLVTGDRENLRYGEVWVNSENTDMQMDGYYGRSTSATIRYLGARKDPATGLVTEDTIGNALAAAVGNATRVAPAHVLVTPPGELRANGVKHIFHVAAVEGEPREGYRPIERIERCVTSAIRRAGQLEDDPPATILFPIFGTGPAGADLADHATRCFGAAVDALETDLGGNALHTAYFYVWTDTDLEICRAVIAADDRLTQP